MTRLHDAILVSLMLVVNTSALAQERDSLLGQEEVMERFESIKRDVRDRILEEERLITGILEGGRWVGEITGIDEEGDRWVGEITGIDEEGGRWVGEITGIDAEGGRWVGEITGIDEEGRRWVGEVIRIDEGEGRIEDIEGGEGESGIPEESIPWSVPGTEDTSPVWPMPESFEVDPAVESWLDQNMQSSTDEAVTTEQQQLPLRETEVAFLDDPEIKEEIIRNIRNPVLALCGGSVWSTRGDGVWIEATERLGDHFRKAARTVGFLRAYRKVDSDTINTLDFRREIGTVISISPKYVLTNRHLVEGNERAHGIGVFNGTSWALRSRLRYVATFLNEATTCPNKAGTKHFEIERIVAVGRGREWGEDFALLEVKGLGGVTLNDWMTFGGSVDLRPVVRVAVIGYPSRPSLSEYERALDVDIPEQFDKVIDRLYRLPDGNVPPEFGVQRVSFGEIIQQYSDFERGILGHTSSTVGGNSGSLLLRLDDGSAVGLHFGGRGSVIDPQGMNLAISSQVVANFLLEHGIDPGN